MNRNPPLDPPLNDRSWRWLMRHNSPFGFMKSHSREVRLWRHEREGESNFILMVSLWKKKKKEKMGDDGDPHNRKERERQQLLSQKKIPQHYFFNPPETDVTIKNTSLNISHCLLKCISETHSYISWQCFINNSSYLSNKLLLESGGFSYIRMIRLEDSLLFLFIFLAGWLSLLSFTALAFT